jgi:cobalt-zinc-cadmium efflux system membrane fusion protein
VVEATGNVAFNGDRSTQVLSPVSGPATRVIGTPGMVVHRGEPLAYVSSPDFASAVADYRKAQSGFRNAKRIADRDSALFKNDALARGELEQAQADLAAAEADVDAAVENMRALGVDEAQIQAVRTARPRRSPPSSKRRSTARSSRSSFRTDSFCRRGARRASRSPI